MSNLTRNFERTPLRAPVAAPYPKGLFLTFEGGDGGGKSTQIAKLAAWLSGVESPLPGAPITVTKEPGGSELGAKIRELILHSELVADRAEALLYAADRAHHIATVVRPALEAGGIVLGDRYLDSSVAYQGVGRKLDPSDVLELSLWATEGLLPHVTILLDISPSALLERRAAETHDRLERAGTEFHQAVRETFLELARREPERWIIVDAAQSIEDVHAEITAKLTDWLRAHNHMLVPPPAHPAPGANPDSLL